jgi:hypothetical protein
MNNNINNLVERVLNMDDRFLQGFIKQQNSIYFNNESKEALENLDNEQIKRILAGSMVRQLLYESDDGFDDRMNE